MLLLSFQMLLAVDVGPCQLLCSAVVGNDGDVVAGSDGPVTATGGGSMNLTSPITLCQRADVEAQRGFDGRCGSLLDSIQLFLISWQHCKASA